MVARRLSRVLDLEESPTLAATIASLDMPEARRLIQGSTDKYRCCWLISHRSGRLPNPTIGVI